MTKNFSASFQCWYCEKNLFNNRYVIQNNFAVCLYCFEEKYSHHCFQCQKIIGMEMQGKIFQEKTWHNTCFNCSSCKASLINEKFAYRNEELYCRTCFIEKFAERCYRCNRSLEPGNRCIEYDRKLYHKSCFVCHACQKVITNLDFRRRDQYFLCLSCHLHLLAIYCIKCHQAITNNGVLYHNHPFHSDCFLCTYCSNPIQNQRYLEYNHDAYCISCSKKLFSK